MAFSLLKSQVPVTMLQRELQPAFAASLALPLGVRARPRRHHLLLFSRCFQPTASRRRAQRQLCRGICAALRRRRVLPGVMGGQCCHRLPSALCPPTRTATTSRSASCRLLRANEAVRLAQVRGRW